MNKLKAIKTKNHYDQDDAIRLGLKCAYCIDIFKVELNIKTTIV